jgi:peptidoglycan hydrolase CwlO-like protein
MTDEDRLTRLEGMVEKLVRVSLSFDERQDALAAAQANSNAKIAALADAQIQTQEALVKLTGNVAEIAARMVELVGKVDELAGRMDELAGTMDELAESQKHTDQRLDALIDIVREQRNGRQPPQP